MKRIKCRNGHYYDSDKYTSCPFCEKEQSAEIKETPVPVKNDEPAKNTEPPKSNTAKKAKVVNM